MISPSIVQLNPDSTGKKVRNLQAEVLQSDGTVAVVHMQVVSLVGADGEPVDLEDAGWKAAVIDRLDTLAELLGAMMADGDDGTGTREPK